MLWKQGKRKKQKLHMLWQPATLIKGGTGFVPLFFLTDCLKTKANLKMEVVNSDQPKTLESIFLSKFCDA